MLRLVACLPAGCLLNEGARESSSRQVITPARYDEGTFATNHKAATAKRGYHNITGFYELKLAATQVQVIESIRCDIQQKCCLHGDQRIGAFSARNYFEIGWFTRKMVYTRD